MGAQVERVPRGTQVADSAAGQDFGRWFRQQRELRGISIWFVAARTKISPERIQGAEDGTLLLGHDGHARATARAMARAIGADPDEAVSRLSRSYWRSGGRPGNGLWRAKLLRWGRHVSVALVLGLAGWILASWLLRPGPVEESPALVYRTDYVKRLLWGDGSQSLGDAAADKACSARACDSAGRTAGPAGLSLSGG